MLELSIEYLIKCAYGLLLIPLRARGNIRRSLLYPGTYSHTWVFPSVPVVLSVIITPDLFLFMGELFSITGWRTVISFLIVDIIGKGINYL